ncbi:MAG: hypothetical protein IJJ33_14145 [Victivallales bacterium]|nr:hypothetical protein [Victivallales bacterium]
MPHSTSIIDKSVTFLLVCACLALAADSLLKNGDCETLAEKTGLACPVHVSSGQHSGSQGKWSADTQTAHGGKASAFLEKENQAGWCDLAFATPAFPPLETPKELEVKLWLKAEECTSGQIVLTGADDTRHQALWKSLGTYRGSHDWRERAFRIPIPEGIRKLTLSVRLSKGTGKIWVDDVSLAWRDLDTPLLYNADFELGTQPNRTIPVGWEEREFRGFEANATVSLIRRGSGNAVQLAWVSGGSRFGLQSQFLSVGANRSLAISAKFRCQDYRQSGSVPGAFRIEFFNARKEAIGDAESKTFTSKNWVEKSFAFTAPEDCAYLRVVLLLAGEGKVMFDDVKILKEREAFLATFPLQAVSAHLENSLVWNHGKPVFHTFADSPTTLNFNFKGEKEKFQSPAFVLELPECLELAQCFEAHTDLDSPVVEPEITAIAKDGAPYTRYTFRNTTVWQRLQRNHAWHRDLSMAILPRPGTPIPYTSQAFWHLENDGKANAESSFTITILPPLPDLPLPKGFQGGYWSCQTYDFPDQELFLKVIRKYEKTKMTWRKRHRSRTALDDMLKSRGWAMATEAPSFDYGYKWGIPKDIPGHEKIAAAIRSRIFDGKLDTHKLCPEYVLNDPDYVAFARLRLQKNLSNHHCQDGEVVTLDTEPWSPLKWCQCEFCRAAFAKFAGLSATPSMEAILKDMSDDWVRFRCKQMADIIGRFEEYIREVYPNALIMDYDYLLPYQNAEALRSHLRGVAKDTRLTEQHLDGHIQSMYHLFNASGFDYVQINHRTLKKSYHVIPAIDPPGGYLQPFEVLSPRMFALNLLASAALGAQGWWIYTDSDTDGLYFVEIQKAMAEIARLEEYFATPETDGLSVVDGAGPAFTRENAVRFATRQLPDGRILLSLFNFAPAHADVSVALAQGTLASAQDALTGESSPVPANGALPCTIPAESAMHLFLK